MAINKIFKPNILNTSWNRAEQIFSKHRGFHFKTNTCFLQCGKCTCGGWGQSIQIYNRANMKTVLKSNVKLPLKHTAKGKHSLSHYVTIVDMHDSYTRCKE